MISESLRHIIHREKLLIDITRHSDYDSWTLDKTKTGTTIRGKCIPEETWTDQSKAEIHRQGYRRCYGLKSDSVFMICPVFVRFHGFYRYNWEDDPEACLDTASSLYDYHQSKAESDFKRGLTTKAKRPDIDTKTLTTIAIIGGGVILGVILMMGVF